jgi:hypothetical protein
VACQEERNTHWNAELNTDQGSGVFRRRVGGRPRRATALGWLFPLLLILCAASAHAQGVLTNGDNYTGA